MQKPYASPQQTGQGSGLTHIVSGQQRLKQQVGCAPEQQRSKTAGILNCKRSNVQGRAEAKASSDCQPS